MIQTNIQIYLYQKNDMNEYPNIFLWKNNMNEYPNIFVSNIWIFVTPWYKYTCNCVAKWAMWWLRAFWRETPFVKFTRNFRLLKNIVYCVHLARFSLYRVDIARSLQKYRSWWWWGRWDDDHQQYYNHHRHQLTFGEASLKRRSDEMDGLEIYVKGTAVGQLKRS